VEFLLSDKDLIGGSITTQRKAIRSFTHSSCRCRIGWKSSPNSAYTTLSSQITQLKENWEFVFNSLLQYEILLAVNKYRE